jgi:hypothetical protein
MAGKDLPEEIHRPLFHLRFFDIVNAAAERVIDCIPGLQPAHIVLINQKAKHLKDSYCRMSLMQMDRIAEFELV